MTLLKRFALLTVAAALALTVASCAQSADSAAQSPASDAQAAEVTIGLTYIPNVQFSPVYVAHDDGLYSAQGLNATVRHHGSDEGLFTALVAGQEQVVVASGDEAVVAASQGMDLVSIGSYYRSFPGVVLVPADSPIRALADLKGRTIGIPGEYGSSWYATRAALVQAGLAVEDVTISSIGYTQQAAMAQGHVDAVVGFTNNDYVQMRAAGLDVRQIPLEESTPLVAASIITTRVWASAHPEEAKAVVEATRQGIESVARDGAHALDVTKTWDDSLSDETRVASAKAVLEATIPLFTDDMGTVSSAQDLDRWKRMGEFLQTIPGLLGSTVDASTVVTNDYAKTA